MIPEAVGEVKNLLYQSRDEGKAKLNWFLAGAMKSLLSHAKDMEYNETDSMKFGVNLFGDTEFNYTRDNDENNFFNILTRF